MEIEIRINPLFVAGKFIVFRDKVSFNFMLTWDEAWGIVYKDKE